MELVYESRHYRFTREKTGVLVLLRTAEPWALNAEISVETQRLARTFPPPGSCGLVFDMRIAPPRNDPEFEALMVKFRAIVAATFPRVAVILKSRSGIMHVTRLNHAEGTAFYPTLDEDEAKAFAELGPAR